MYVLCAQNIQESAHMSAVLTILLLSSRLLEQLVGFRFGEGKL